MNLAFGRLSTNEVDSHYTIFKFSSTKSWLSVLWTYWAAFRSDTTYLSCSGDYKAKEHSRK